MTVPAPTVLPPMCTALTGAAFEMPHSLRSCWRNGCGAPTDPTDELGLCPDCVADLREATNA